MVGCVPETGGQNTFRAPRGKMWDLAQHSAELADKRQLEGVSDAAMETPMLQEELGAPKRKHEQCYGYGLDSFELLWPHLVGRVEKEIEQTCLTTVALTRCGSEAEGGRNPSTRQWPTAPGVATMVGGMPD